MNVKMMDPSFLLDSGVRMSRGPLHFRVNTDLGSPMLFPEIG
jgi:hypothetical protein